MEAVTRARSLLRSLPTRVPGLLFGDAAAVNTDGRAGVGGRGRVVASSSSYLRMGGIKRAGKVYLRRWTKEGL